MEFDSGVAPTFLEETRNVRESEWVVNEIPPCLLDRRVEITGPPTRKGVVNALNSGAKVFMADFEDSLCPTFPQLLDGQRNLRDAVHRSIDFEDSKSGKQYNLKEDAAILFVRPRGLHLEESHVVVNSESVSGSLFDFGLFFFHNALTLSARGEGPFFYLPKLENYLEARWWNDVFLFSQAYLGMSSGNVRATVLIETFPMVFQINETLYELREHSGGCNSGRWDYVFSLIKTFRESRDSIPSGLSFNDLQIDFSNLVFC